MHAFVLVHSAVPIIVARGGGGGSGGGGGGGDGIAVFLAIGYVPMHLVGAWIRRLQKKHEVLFDILQIVGWVVAAVYMVLLVIALHLLGVLAAIGAVLGIGAGLYNWFSLLKQSKKTAVALQAAVAKDRAWSEPALLINAQSVFNRFQQDWSNNNAEAMKAYMTQHYQYHNALMIYALQLAGRRNQVGNPVISQSTVTAVQDAVDDNNDLVTIGFEASANDQLIDVATNKVLFTDPKPFTEFWQFRRSGNNWLLDGIQQATANTWSGNASLEQFAAQHNYCYSLDWGWLMLPKRGQLFKGTKFGTSDVNNHVIGMYNQQLLVQLYTYVSNPAQATKSYLIAQANLPRSYGDIVVRKRKGFHFFGIKGLREVSTEWPDFNKKYQVYATNPEQATSLELLNPSYMQKLEAVPFEVNIEVIDNVVYLYTAEKAVVQTEHYETLLSLLQEAFKEMRL